jgi:hypothetical protein
MKHWMFMSNILQRFWASPNSQSSLCHNHCHHFQVAIAHHGTVPNNPDPVPTSINLSLQQLIIATTNIPPTIDVLAFVNPVGKFF